MASSQSCPMVSGMILSDRSERIYYDSHMHTPLCKHATGHPSEYVAMGVGRGLAGVIFTCHSPMPNKFSHAVRMDPSEFDEYCDLIQEAADQAPEGFEVLLGMESDFYPGMESWLEELHGKADFHYILGSVHWHISEYMNDFWKGDLADFQEQYFIHLAQSAESGLFDCLAHPDLVKNADPDEWRIEEVSPLIAMALDRIAETGVAMELNTSGLRKSYSQMNPGPEMLEMMCERNIPVVIGSDSHVPERVGAQFENALTHLEDAGYENVSVFKNRKRREIAIADARSSLRDPMAVR